MKQLTLIFCAVLIFSNHTFSQDYSQKFGKITQDELSMTSYAPAPDAEAVIIYEDVNLRFDIANKITYSYYYRVKIKILTKEGTSWGDVQIKTYSNKGTNEYLSGLDATAYNLVDGKMVKTDLKKQYIVKEKLDDKITLTKFSVPEVRVGTVIEYKYTITSDYYYSVPDIEIQHSIPVIKSTAKYEIPDFLMFLGRQHGEHHVNIVREKNNQISGTWQYATNIYKCDTDNVPALKSESHVWAINDMRSKIEFELSAINLPRQIPQYFSHTWEDVNKTLDESSFSKNLKTSYPFKEEVTAIKNSSDDAITKLRKALKLVQSQIKWNGKYSLSSSSPNSAAQKGTGSSSDINFVLHSILRDIGFDVTPILLNPRHFGRLPLAYATIDKINAFIVRVKLDNDKYVYVDGTNKYGDINVMPTSLLVDRARIYKASEHDGWVNLTNLAKNIISVSVVGKVNEDGTLSGTIKRTYTNQATYSIANRYDSYKDVDEYKQSLEKEDNLTITDYNIDGLGSPMITETITFSTDLNATDDIVYLNSLVLPFMSKNPLTEQERKLPIEFDYPKSYKVFCNIEIPENYTVEEIPEKSAMKVCEGGMNCSYMAAANNNTLQMRFTLDENRIFYTANEYKDLSMFYGLIVQLSGSQIVLKK